VKRCKKCKAEVKALACPKCGGTDYEIVYSIIKMNPFLGEVRHNG